MTTAFRYTVMPGDSYSQIAAQLALCPGLTEGQLAAANPSVDPTLLAVGQVINIPVTVSVPDPVPNPVPILTPSPASDQGQIGFWRRTWVPSATPPSGCNLGLAFSGWTSVKQALLESSTVYNGLPDLKYITLGGGNDNGAFNAANVQKITTAITEGMFDSYVGIAYDIEEGESGLADAFAQSFAAAKAKGFKVLVTTSRSAPYGIGDAVSLMKAFFADPNIDFLSPQLYTTGSETQNQYTTAGFVTWEMFARANAKVIPSIVKASMYADAQAYFAQRGVTLAGFVQWSQS